LVFIIILRSKQVNAHILVIGIFELFIMFVLITKEVLFAVF